MPVAADTFPHCPCSSLRTVCRRDALRPPRWRRRATTATGFHLACRRVTATKVARPPRLRQVQGVTPTPPPLLAAPVLFLTNRSRHPPHLFLSMAGLRAHRHVHRAAGVTRGHGRLRPRAVRPVLLGHIPLGEIFGCLTRFGESVSVSISHYRCRWRSCVWVYLVRMPSFFCESFGGFKSNKDNHSATSTTYLSNVFQPRRLHRHEHTKLLCVARF